MKRVIFLSTLFVWSFALFSFPSPIPSFTIDFLAVNQETRTAYAASSEMLADNDYAIFSRSALSDTRIPLAPAKATVNRVAEAPNPLYGAGFSFFALMNNRPCGVALDADNRLFCYLAYSDSQNISILTSEPLRDANGSIASHIVSFSASDMVVDDAFSRMYALVKNNAGDNFGAPGSGIVVAKIAGEKDSQFIESMQAIEISNSSLGLKIGSDVTILNDDYFIKPALYCNAYIGSVYSGFVVQASTDSGSGARSVLLGAGEITPASAIGSDSIIGTAVPGKKVAAIHLASLSALNGASYLIVHGGVFDEYIYEVSSKVYALPLVNGGVSPYIGTLAAVHSEPVSGKYVLPALSSGDLYTSADMPAIVGTSDAPGEVTNMWVFNDTVYVSTNYGYAHAHVKDGEESARGFVGTFYAPGIFCSRPLYDVHGLIKGWTAWRRVGVPADILRSFSIDLLNGTYWYIDSASDLQKTQWEKQNSYVDEAFKSQQAGVQGFFDVPETAESMETAVGSRSSFFIAVGKNRCVLIETGRDIDNVFTPQYASANALVSTDGSLAGLIGENNVIDVSGGAVALCGNIQNALLCHNHNGSGSDYYGWIAIAGSDGCALLSKPDGRGWDYGLTGLTADMSFKKLTSLRDIRKIACDGTYIYILTPTVLARVVLTAENCARGEYAAYTIVAQAPTILGDNDTFMQFTDCVLDAKRILVGSNRGLITSTTTVPLAQCLTEQSYGWQLVTLPDSPKAISRIMVYTNENLGYAQALNNAFVCVLSSYVGYEQARLYALDVAVDTLPQVIEINRLPFWYVWSAYRSHFMCANSINLVGRSMYPTMNETPFVSRSVSPLIKSGALKNDTHGVIPFAGKYLNVIGYISAQGYTVAFNETGMYANGESAVPLSIKA